jgi:rhamnosyltransferase
MISIIIPTLNAGDSLSRTLMALRNQSIKPDEVIIVDSSSADTTVECAKAFGAVVLNVARSEFDHGRTRTLAGKMAKGDFLIYITQDVLFANGNALESLIKPFFTDERIGAAYGRQLPREDASPFADHLRLFNYPSVSSLKTYEDRYRYGLKAASLSNSFAAYRKDALDKIGWFKEKIIMGEDTYAGAKLLSAGYSVAYVAEAQVFHSHNYSCVQEFKRYFDIGVFHRNENWIITNFGGVSGEGGKYVLSELSYLMKIRKHYLIPQSIIRNGFKLIGYQMGKHYNTLPLSLIRKCSMHENWWY